MGSIQAPKRFDLFTGYYNTINGGLRSTRETRHGIDPATGQANSEVPISTPDDVDLAVAAAKVAFKSWSKTDYQYRAERVLAFADGLEKYVPEFAKFLTQEQGKTIKASLFEAKSAVRWLRSLAALKLEEEVIEEDDTRKVVLRHTPLGVSVGIVPRNYPLQLACGKVAPAVLAGNSIIIKPSPFTPYCGLKLGELARQYFPPGVVQVLSGDDNLGPWLTAHPGPEKISFTGSTFTGKKVMASAAKTLKRVTLELLQGREGCCDHLQNTDIKAVAQKVAGLAFANSGQTCVTIKRIYVHEEIHAQFRDAIAEFTRTLTVGDGREEGSMLGPVQNRVQYERVKTFFDDIGKENQSVVVGGQIHQGNPSGYFISPTIIDKPAKEHHDFRIFIGDVT